MRLESLFCFPPGPGSAGTPTEPTPHARHPPPAVPSEESTSSLGRTVSDTELPMYQAASQPSETNTNTRAPNGKDSPQPTVSGELASEDAHSLPLTSTPAAPPHLQLEGEIETMVFCPVSRTHSCRPHPLPASRASSGGDIQVMSPEDPDSCCSSPVDSLHSDTDSSAALNDSLNNSDPSHPLTRAIAVSNSSRASARRVLPTRRKPGGSGQSSQPAAEEVCSVSNGRPKPNIPTLPQHASTTRRPYPPNYDSDSSSSDEFSNYPYQSSGRYRTPPRPRRQPRQTSGDRSGGPRDTETAEHLHLTRKRVSEGGANATEATKIVGILKRPGGSSQSSKAPSAATTACPSEVASAAGSTVMDNTLNGSTMEGVKGSKRVRFVDQTPHTSKPAALRVMDTSARTQLWNKVFPHELSAHFPPNGAFTPKMRVSLNSNGILKKPSTPTPSPPNGLVVRVPHGSERSPPPHSPTSPEGITARNQALKEGKASPKNKGQPVMSSVPSGSKTPSDGSTELSAVDSGAAPEATVGELSTSEDQPIHLDKTPTDEDINRLWHEIKMYFRGKDRVMVPPHEYKFSLENSSSRGNRQVFVTVPARQLTRRHNIQKHHGHTNTASPQHGGLGAGGEKHLVHRQQNRPLRCQYEPHHATQLTEQKPGHSLGHAHQKQQSYVHEREQHGSEAMQQHRHHPTAQASVREPSMSASTTGSSTGRTGEYWSLCGCVSVTDSKFIVPL